MYKFKVNDTIQVTAGKDKGRTGKVLEVDPKAHKVLVEIPERNPPRSSKRAWTQEH
ncbi:MAG: 50S ribosomal protein L24 [Candidatus Collierbacteria bacterium GW2011_GWC1_45_47]|nr:MAG: 50S ribosomal protein L24 [Candidatus Collierbacteria bacterium GW2011_GWC1_45_47]